MEDLRKQILLSAFQNELEKLSAQRLQEKTAGFAVKTHFRNAGTSGHALQGWIDKLVSPAVNQVVKKEGA